MGTRSGERLKGKRERVFGKTTRIVVRVISGGYEETHCSETSLESMRETIVKTLSDGGYTT